MILSGASATIPDTECGEDADQDNHMVLLDLELPDWSRPLVRLGILLTSGFGVNEEIARRHPWESMAAVFGNMQKSEVYFGAVYFAVSEKRPSATTN